MKKLVAIAISCLIPFFSFAGDADSNRVIDTFQERCAKEQDPVKRQNYCHMLDQSEANLISLQETVVV